MLLFSPVKVNQLSHGMTYPFKINEANLDKLAVNQLQALKDFLNYVFYKCPDQLFRLEGPRASQLRFPLNVEITEDANSGICTSAANALSNRGHNMPHDAVEDYMLENDTNTVVAEAPLWASYFELQGTGISEKIKDTNPLTGHIDLLQIKEGKVNILDFKPKAAKEKWAPTQLFAYALMLSKRTGLNLENFRCSYFDEKTSFWFNPAQVKI